MPRAASSHVVDGESWLTSAGQRTLPRRRAALCVRMLNAANPIPGQEGVLFIQSSSGPTLREGRWRCGEAAPVKGAGAGSGDGDLFVEVDVLNPVDHGGPLGHRPLEGLAADDEAHATGPLVDDGGAHGLGQVAVALGLAARVDETDAAGVAVD